jgi:D-sedoheptulose 7-phosphate isomerase
MYELLDEYFTEYEGIIRSIDYDALVTATKMMRESQVIFFAGNGGSQASASHMAGDLSINTPLNIPITALGDNPTIFSATGNDIDYESVFSRELKLKAGSCIAQHALVVLISTSGKSKNIVKCAKVARGLGMRIIALVGSHTETLDEYANLVISVDSLDAGFVEAAHDFVGHMLVRLVKDRLASL